MTNEEFEQAVRTARRRYDTITRDAVKKRSQALAVADTTYRAAIAAALRNRQETEDIVFADFQKTVLDAVKGRSISVTDALKAYAETASQIPHIQT